MSTDNTCYTDFASMSDPNYIERALQGNWSTELNYRTNEEVLIPSNRAVGLASVYYQPNDMMTIQVRGDDNFVKNVKDTLRTKVFPYVNLEFQFVDKDGDCLIDNKWSSGGVTYGGGTRNPTLHLGNSSPFLTIHEFGHALGMQHEMRNPEIDLTWITSALQMKYAKGNINIFTQIIKPLDYSKVKALPFDKNSVMIYPLSGDTNLENIEMKPAEEFTDIDKQWLEMTYGTKKNN